MRHTLKPARLAPVLIAALALSACQRQVGETADEPVLRVADAEAGAVVTRTCESGQTVAVQAVGERLLQLTYRDQSYELTRIPAAQGQAFQGGAASWTVVNQGDEEVATLSLINASGDRAVAEVCRRPVAQLVAEPVQTGLKPCISPDLAYGVEAGDAGMGHRLTTLRVENEGRTACQLSGYPRVSLIGKEGQSLSTIKANTRTESYFGRIKAGVPIMLKPGDKAYFDLGWSVIAHEDQGEKTCPEARAVEIAPPGDTGGKRLALALTVCGGSIEVSPYRAGASRESVILPAS